MAGTVAASGLAITGCAPTHAGAAATVGGDRITVNQVKAGAATMLADSGTKDSAAADPAGLQRSVLTRLITNDLVADAARSKGVTVSEGDVQTALVSAKQAQGGEAQLESAAAQSGVAAADIHDYLYYELLREKLGAALTVDAKVPTIDLRVIAVADKATADKVLALVQADPTQFAAAVQQYSQDSSTVPNGGDIGDVPLVALNEPLQTDVASKAVGDIFEEVIGGQYYIFLVHSRETTAISDLDSSMAQQFQLQALNDYLSTVAKQNPVSVSPRYGAWDAAKVTVVASPGALSSSATTVVSPPPSSPGASG